MLRRLRDCAIRYACRDEIENAEEPGDNHIIDISAMFERRRCHHDHASPIAVRLTNGGAFHRRSALGLIMRSHHAASFA